MLLGYRDIDIYDLFHDQAMKKDLPMKNEHNLPSCYLNVHLYYEKDIRHYYSAEERANNAMSQLDSQEKEEEHVKVRNECQERYSL